MMAPHGGRESWAPLCMSAAEWRDWSLLNPDLDGRKADRPCADCPESWAAAMRAEHRCNGEPGEAGAADPEDAAEVTT